MPTSPDTFADFTLTYIAGGAGGVGTALNAGDTTLYLPTGLGARYPATGPFMALIGSAASLASGELVKCTARVSDTLTVVRAQEGTSAQTWAVGTAIQQTLTAGNLANLWTRLQGGPYNVRDYGAVGNGSTDDTAALQAAIAAAGAAGGGVVYLPAATYVISSTLAIGNGSSGVASTINGVTVRGDGMYATTIKWNGASGGVIAQILGVCSGNMFCDLTLDGNGGLAATGLDIISACYAHCPTIRVINTTSCCLLLDAWSAASPNQDAMGLSFGKVVVQCAAGTSVAQSHGVWLKGQGGAGAWDTSQCSFANVTIYAQSAYNTAMRWGFSDFNYFGVVNAYFFSTTGRIGLYVEGVVSNFPQNNYVALANFGGAYSTTGSPGNNYIGLYDTNDNAGAAPGPASGLAGMAEPLGGALPPYPFGSGAVVNVPAEALDQQLTTTSATTVAVANFATAGLYMANLQVRISGGSAATVTAVAKATDDSGSVISYFFLGLFPGSGTSYFAFNTSSFSPGSYTTIPIVLRYSGSGTAPQIVVTAATANVVFVSASIIKVG